MIALVAFGMLLICQTGTADVACTLQGGTCVDWRYYVCNAGVETGLCDGDTNRRCCLDCDFQCQASEAESEACCDSGCTAIAGNCQHNSNYCDGFYSSGKCGGSNERQCCAKSTGGGGSGCYGDITNVDTTGASYATASQDNLGYSGVSASRSMAGNDLAAMGKYKTKINQAASALCVDPAVIAGIISRETRAGKVIGDDGFGADGHGYGIMQVDDRYHTIRGGPESLEHIKQGTEILIGMIDGVGNKHRTWTTDMVLKGGICAYNSGVSNVQTYENMDEGTTGNDYSNDVTARSQYYKENGYTI